MKYEVHKHFLKTYAKLPQRIRGKVDERLMLFLQDPFAEVLHNHELKGNFGGYRSINLIGSCLLS